MIRDGLPRFEPRPSGSPLQQDRDCSAAGFAGTELESPRSYFADIGNSIAPERSRESPPCLSRTHAVRVAEFVRPHTRTFASKATQVGTAPGSRNSSSMRRRSFDPASYQVLIEMFFCSRLYPMMNAVLPAFVLSGTASLDGMNA
jgi:hypothetical protein